MTPHALEMVYTRWESACKEPTISTTGLRECRRHAHHTGVHASDHPYYEWEPTP